MHHNTRRAALKRLEVGVRYLQDTIDVVTGGKQPEFKTTDLKVLSTNTRKIYKEAIKSYTKLLSQAHELECFLEEIDYLYWQE